MRECGRALLLDSAFSGPIFFLCNGHAQVSAMGRVAAFSSSAMAPATGTMELFGSDAFFFPLGIRIHTYLARIFFSPLLPSIPRQYLMRKKTPRAPCPWLANRQLLPVTACFSLFWRSTSLDWARRVVHALAAFSSRNRGLGAASQRAEPWESTR